MNIDNDASCAFWIGSILGLILGMIIMYNIFSSQVYCVIKDELREKPITYFVKENYIPFQIKVTKTRCVPEVK